MYDTIKFPSCTTETQSPFTSTLESARCRRNWMRDEAAAAKLALLPRVLLSDTLILTSRVWATGAQQVPREASSRIFRLPTLRSSYARHFLQRVPGTPSLYRIHRYIEFPRRWSNSCANIIKYNPFESDRATRKSLAKRLSTRNLPRAEKEWFGNFWQTACDMAGNSIVALDNSWAGEMVYCAFNWWSVFWIYQVSALTFENTNECLKHAHIIQC